MKRTGRTFAVVGAAAAVAAALGCTETTVKPTKRRILTAEEAARTAREREEAAENGEAERTPRPPASLEEEAERLRAQIEREPQNPKWHFLLGLVYERQKRYELAELRYRRGAELIPPGRYTGPTYYLGRVLAKQGKWAQALAELEKTIAVKPADIEGYYLNPDYRESYFLIGAISYRLGDLTRSERAFRDYLKYGGETKRVIDFFPELVAE